VQPPQAGEGDQHLGEGGLPGAVREQAGLDQPVQRLGEGVVLALPDAAIVLGA
jgi:hypothetical protein